MRSAFKSVSICACVGFEELQGVIYIYLYLSSGLGQMLSGSNKSGSRRFRGRFAQRALISREPFIGVGNARVSLYSYTNTHVYTSIRVSEWRVS